MDQIPSISDDNVIDSGFTSKSDSLTSSQDSFPESNTKKEKVEEYKKPGQLNSLEMDRTCIRPMNTDDIISKELPFKILDTDFDGKDEDSVPSPADISSTLCEYRDRNDNDPIVAPEKTSNEQFIVDATEQDTGYSSDVAEIVKSASTESITPDETKENEKIHQSPSITNESKEPLSNGEDIRADNESSEPVSNGEDVRDDNESNEHMSNGEDVRVDNESSEPVSNGEDIEADKTDDFSNTNSETSVLSRSESNAKNSNGFVPTIVGIRGSYHSAESNEATFSSSSGEIEAKTSSNAPVQEMNIINIQGSREKPEFSNENTIEIRDEDDNNISNCAENNPTISSFSTDLDIKQEPPENADNNDCIFDDTQNEDRCFTSEIFIEEERANFKEKEEEEEVICIESSGKIPLPIPIKKEAHIDCSEQSKISNLKTSNENKTPSTTLKRSLPIVKDAHVFSIGYTCHMCNMTFQEHELLNDHMTLHRNNLVDPNKSKLKTKPICPICNRQLSTLQSLQQHVMIHSEEKPHVCNTCGRHFRHLSNYKLHLQKHESEQAEKSRTKATVGKSVPSYTKPIGSHNSSRVMNQNQVTNMNTPKSSFSTTESFRRDNAKENVNLLYRSFTCKNRAGKLITRTRIVDDMDDDVIPLKTFSNFENIVMNAARFIVKVDTIDTNVLKRKIKTPDISIDKNATYDGKLLREKNKVLLSPSDNSKRLKLDQIENIIIDNDVEFDKNLVDKDDDQDYDYDFGDDSVDVDSDSPETGNSEHMTDKELVALLSDDHENKNKAPSNDDVSELRRNAQMILKSEAEKSKNSQPNSSNVIMLKCGSKQMVTNKASSLPLSEAPYESYTNGSSDDETTVTDDFDKAFNRVALRRLLLIQKRAAKNNGKIDSKYLLGPLFWRKALRRVKLNPIDFDVNTLPESMSPQLSDSAESNKFSKPDERRTNDPQLLQIRAENKFSFLLDKIQLTNSTNNLNLVGPLFWKKTLQLAGVHNPRDLSNFLDKERLSLQNVEFVDDEPSFARRSKNVSNTDESNASDLYRMDTEPAQKNSDNSVKNCDPSNDKSTLVDSILSDVVLPRCPNQSNDMDVSESSSSNVFAKSSSILYDSLTKPRTVSSKSDNELIPPTNTNMEDENESKSDNSSEQVKEEKSSLPVDINDSRVINEVHCNSDPIVDDAGVSKVDPGVSNESNTSAIETNEDVDSTNIVLNVGDNFPLIASNSDKLAELSDGTNYVLVSDETGAMQLVKENDLRLVESNDASGDAQYVVNLQGENYANLGLVGQVNGEQHMSYALQFDGENYTAIQLVQDEPSTDEKTLKSLGGTIDNGTTILKATETGEPTTYILPTVSTDLNSIGKELSDFLNLNYSSQMKNENNQT